MSQKRQYKSDQGFTLLEILAAVAIMGISLVTIIGLQVKTIRLQQVSNRTTIATLLAQEKLNEKIMEMRINKYTSPPFYFEEGSFDDEEGALDETYKNYAWEYTISALPNADDLYIMELSVNWNPEAKEGNSVTLTTFIQMN